MGNQQRSWGMRIDEDKVTTVGGFAAPEHIARGIGMEGW